MRELLTHSCNDFEVAPLTLNFFKASIVFAQISFPLITYPEIKNEGKNKHE
jgi:hypothetical protein